MPVDHRLVLEQRLVVLTYAGSVTVAEWTEALQAVLAEPDYQPGFNLLVDRRASALPTRAFADGVATFIRQHREQFRNARVAILVSDVAAFGMARMQEMLNESLDLDTRAFKSEPDAYAWLGVSH